MEVMSVMAKFKIRVTVGMSGMKSGKRKRRMRIWDAKSERWMRARNGKKILHCWPSIMRIGQKSPALKKKLDDLGNWGQRDEQSAPLNAP